MMPWLLRLSNCSGGLEPRAKFIMRTVHMEVGLRGYGVSPEPNKDRVLLSVSVEASSAYWSAKKVLEPPQTSSRMMAPPSI